MNSPCISICKIQNGICVGCERTLKEITEWGQSNMGDRMELMKQLSGKTHTHNCPSCGGPAYCAMEEGKSASACWCMSLESVNLKSNSEDLDENASCHCRTCLKKAI